MVDCIEKTGKELTINNQDIVKYICGIEEERKNLELIIQKQYQERKKIETEIERLTYKLCLINKSLSMRIKAKNNYDKALEEITAHYEKLVDSSNKLKQIVEKSQQELDDIMNKKTGTCSGPEGEEIQMLYVKSKYPTKCDNNRGPNPDDCPCAPTEIPTREQKKAVTVVRHDTASIKSPSTNSSAENEAAPLPPKRQESSQSDTTENSLSVKEMDNYVQQPEQAKWDVNETEGSRPKSSEEVLVGNDIDLENQIAMNNGSNTAIGKTSETTLPDGAFSHLPEISETFVPPLTMQAKQPHHHSVYEDEKFYDQRGPPSSFLDTRVSRVSDVHTKNLLLARIKDMAKTSSESSSVPRQSRIMSQDEVKVPQKAAKQRMEVKPSDVQLMNKFQKRSIHDILEQDNANNK